MTPEQLVPSRETCERLKAAGWTAETHFVWAKTLRGWSVVERRSLTEVLPEDLSAPTLAELLAELPAGCSFSNRAFVSPDRVEFWASSSDLYAQHEYGHASAAEAAAKLWIALRERVVPAGGPLGPPSPQEEVNHD